MELVEEDKHSSFGERGERKKEKENSAHSLLRDSRSHCPAKEVEKPVRGGGRGGRGRG